MRRLNLVRKVQKMEFHEKCILQVKKFTLKKAAHGYIDFYRKHLFS
jgi:hypothetical protein